MLRNLFLGGVSHQVLYAPEDGSGAGGGADDAAAAAEATRLAAEGAGDGGAAGGDGGGADDAAAAQAAAEAAAAAAKAATQAAKAPKDWRDKEIARKHAQLQAEKAENARLQEMLEAATRRPAAQASPAGDDAAAAQAAAEAAAAARPAAPRLPAGQTDDARIEARARQIAAATSAEEQLSTAFSVGKASHGTEWDGAIENIKTLGGFDPDTMTDILATDNPAQVLFELGKTPERFQEVMELPPAKRRAQLVKIGMAPPPPPPKKPVSDAPGPVETLPAGGSGRSGAPTFDLYDAKIPFGSWEKSPFEAQKSDSDRNDEKWFAARRAQKEASTGRPWSKQR